jgi:hypothetical protein
MHPFDFIYFGCGCIRVIIVDKLLFLISYLFSLVCGTKEMVKKVTALLMRIGASFGKVYQKEARQM